MIALRVDALRRMRGDMTQGELAKKAGVSRTTVAKIELGYAGSVTFETVNKLARALECDADVLVTFETESPKKRAS
jgi:DNA-binding Xre family transcriptional regulator